MKIITIFPDIFIFMTDNYRSRYRHSHALQEKQDFEDAYIYTT